MIYKDVSFQDFWKIQPNYGVQNNENLYLGFGRGYEFLETRNLQKMTSRLPEGSVISSPSIVAGKEHLYLILIQCAEYWNRGILLARNKSIDLLLRMTCQNQISKAIEASELQRRKDVALFGLVKEHTQIDLAERLILELGGKRNDSILDLDSKKLRFLLYFHSLPSWVDRKSLPELLQEKSAILVFPN
jgi:tRNA threonylcarbamoyladenosine modification (KEOPS) complex Cgi121 subunit